VLFLGHAFGCSAHPRVTSCTDDLTGVWVDGSGGRWMLLDHGATLEGYPMFDDAAGSHDVIGAPRVVDLHRTPTGLDGQVKRRYQHRADTCDARAAVHVTACGDDLDLTIVEPAAPLELGPCRWPDPAVLRAERWHRE